MLDQYFEWRNNHRFTLSSPTYTPKDAIEKRTFSNCLSNKLAVLFSPWHGAELVYNRLAKRLIDQGWSVVCYELSPEILKANVAQVLESFFTLQTVITQDLNQLVSDNHYSQVHLIGTSLGNETLMLVANKFSAFTDVSMVGPASNLARSTWEGLRTQDIRAEFVKQGIDESGLVTAWDSIAASNYVTAFNNKRVNIVISKSDEVIPTKYQLEYLSAIQKTDANLRFTYTHLGLYASVVNFCLFSKIHNHS